MPRPIKILHILHGFSHGGLENGIVNIINGSPPDLEHELCLLTTAGEFIERLRARVQYYELHRQPGNSLHTILELYRIIRQSGAHIVHTRNWGAFDGVLASCLCPGITVLHGEHGRDIGDPEGLNRRRNFVRRLLSVRIRKFTTVSEDLARWLSEAVGIPRRHVEVIQNGVDTGCFKPHRDPGLRRELGIPLDAFVVGTICRLDPVKNIAGLIRSFARLNSENAGSRLVIVGEGPDRGPLENLVRTTPGIPTPIMTGYRSDVRRFYGLFDVFVLNSFAEGMSNTLLEAMASALPVVCTSVGANGELVRHRERGLIVPTGDEEALKAALCEYLTFQELRARLGKNARLFIEECHSLVGMVERYVQLYRSVGHVGSIPG